MTTITKTGLLERLERGVVVGDGGMLIALEKRGYVTVGPWTPEATCEAPEAVRQLHREFLRAGSDVIQTFSFFATDSKLSVSEEISYSGAQMNKAACSLANQVAAEGHALAAGSVCKTPSYKQGKSKAEVQAEFRKQTQVFADEGIDFLICEYFNYVEEIEWAIEVCKETGLVVCSTMCIGPEGDTSGVSAADCAVRMARAGADVVGVNCRFGPTESLKGLAAMKAGLEAAELHPYLIIQPCVYQTPDSSKNGYTALPEWPFAVEPRVSTRWEIQKWAREAYRLGARYIGGCCGFEAYHIRAISEELAPERGRLPEASKKHAMWGAGLANELEAWERARASEEYWRNLTPATGRPYSAALSRPDA